MQQKTEIAEGIKSFADLIKYKLSAAVTFSGVTGYFIFKAVPEKDLGLLICGLFLTACGSAALNQYSESELDGIMKRTRQRPIPSRKMSGRQALVFATTLMVCGLCLLSLNGIIPVILGLTNIFLYNLAYTKLKRVTPLALIPGSLVGAVPPLIGYFSAGGIRPDEGILIFSSFMFLWQIPHFWLIGMRYSDDYRSAGFRFNDLFRNSRNTRMVVFVWIVISTLLLIGLSISGRLFYRELYYFLIPLNAIFILLFHSFLFRTENEKNTRSAFILINSFGIAVMLFFIINSFLSAA